jgi:hypothetical protein
MAETGIGGVGYNSALVADLVQIGRSILKSLPTEEEKKTKLSVVKERKRQRQVKDITQQLKAAIKSQDVLSIDLAKIDYDKLLDVRKNSWGKVYPLVVEDRLEVFEENTLGFIIMTAMYRTLEDAAGSSNATALLEKMKSRRLGYLTLETQVQNTQTDLNLKKLDKLLQKKADPKVAESKADKSPARELSPGRTVTEENDPEGSGMDLNPNVQFTLEASHRDKLSTRPRSPAGDAPAAGKTKAIQQTVASIDTIVTNTEKINIKVNQETKEKPGAPESKPDPLEEDLYLHDIYDTLSMDEILTQQGFQFFPP